MLVGNDVWIFAVEVVATRLDFVDTDFPRLFGFLSILTRYATPPVGTALQVFYLHGLGHGIGLLPCWYSVLVEPDVLRRLTLLEELQISTDAGVGFEHAIGQADDSVQVALFEQCFFQPSFYAFAEQGAVGQHDGGTTTGFKQANK